MVRESRPMPLKQGRPGLLLHQSSLFHLGFWQGSFGLCALRLVGVQHPFKIVGVALLQVLQRVALVDLELEPLLKELHAGAVVVEHLSPGLDVDGNVGALVDQSCRNVLANPELAYRADIVADDPEHPLYVDIAKAFIGADGRCIAFNLRDLVLVDLD